MANAASFSLQKANKNNYKIIETFMSYSIKLKYFKELSGNFELVSNCGVLQIFFVKNKKKRLAILVWIIIGAYYCGLKKNGGGG